MAGIGIGRELVGLTHLVAVSDYPILFALVLAASAGAPLPISILLAGLGAASARSGGPDFSLLVASGVLASVAGDGMDYGIGRAGGQRVLHWAQSRLRRYRVFASLGRLGAPPRQEALVFLSRFALTPLATPASLMAGATGLGLGTFLLWDILGEGVFVIGNLMLGRFLSADGLDDGPLLLVAGALALVSYVGIWLLARAAGTRRHARPWRPQWRSTAWLPRTKRVRSERRPSAAASSLSARSTHPPRHLSGVV
jgi:membrane protein DedA with SNARE-associated domain